MLNVGRILVRERSTRALLFVIDTAATPVRLEAAGGTLTVEVKETGRPLVQSPLAVLEILNDEGIQFAAAARLKGERELRHVLVVLEIAAA